MPGWQDGVIGWSIGPKGSGAPVELDEPLGECRVGIFTVSYHVLLWGRAKQLPDVWILPLGKSSARLVPFEPERWLQIDREDLRRVAMGGDVRLRLDQSPVRFGNYIIERLKDTEVAREVCAICNEPVRTYFRIGSSQACAACTEKFRQKFRTNRTRHYWKALGAGMAASVLAAWIHGALVATADISFGPLLIGAFVAAVIRLAARGTGGLRYKITAISLTYVAGTLPVSLLRPDRVPLWTKVGRGLLLPIGIFRSAGPVAANPTTWTFAVYLALGMFAAWGITPANAAPRISGPFQTKTT